MSDHYQIENEIPLKLETIKFSDIITIADIQSFQDIFANTHGVASIITNVDGTPITQPSNFTRLCKSIIRETPKGCANCFHSDAVIGSYNPNGPVVQKCLSGGLWDAGVSISVGGKHIANWLIGQVRNEQVDIEKMIQYAEEIGADKTDFENAFFEVPEMSEDQFRKIADLLYYYANELSENAYRNLLLKEQVKLIHEEKVRYRKLLENLETGIVVHASDTSILRSNPKAWEILGLSDDQLKGKKAIDPTWKFIDEMGESLPLDQYPVNQIVSTKKPISGQIYGIYQPEKKIINWISANGFPVLDVVGNIKEIVISFIDITERIKAEKELIENKQKYQTLFETSNDVNMLIVDGVFVDCNNAALSLFDCDREQIIGSSPVRFSPKFQPNGHSSEEEAQKRIAQALKGESQFFEWEHCRLDGTAFAAEIRLHAVSIGGKPHLQVIIRNVSEYKRSEQTISMLAHAIRSISECVSITDMEDNIIFVNKAFRNTYQYKENELIGKNISIIRSPNNPLDIVNQILPATIDGGWYGELLNLKKDGTEFPVSISTSVIKDENGIPVALIGITNEITERKRAEKLLQEKSDEIAIQNEKLNKTNIELLAAKEKAEESDRLKSAFLANMSHEIRTPMNGILGFSELLKEPNLTGDEQQAYIEIIEKSGARLLNIINDIVDISKIEAGLMKLNLQESNINEQIKYIYTFFKPEVEAKKITFNYKNGLQDEGAFIKIDREKVYAILTNLVKNAIKFTEKGKIVFGYSLKSTQNSPLLEFYVKDSGIGIPKERQNAIFERFIQADITDKMARQGTGLGLAISKAYVEMLGGRIWVESEEGIGSTFYFTLPY
jgi:PAS domain S-box-containing protein